MPVFSHVLVLNENEDPPTKFLHIGKKGVHRVDINFVGNSTGTVTAYTAAGPTADLIPVPNEFDSDPREGFTESGNFTVLGPVYLAFDVANISGEVRVTAIPS